MIELTVLNYLKSVLSVPVFMEIPTSNDITEFVLLEKTGSSRTDFINDSVFVVQSYSDSLFGAASLNEEVKKAMIGDGVNTYGIIAETEVSKCSLNTDYNYTDTTTKSYRYQAVFDLVF